MSQGRDILMIDSSNIHKTGPELRARPVWAKIHPQSHQVVRGFLTPLSWGMQLKYTWIIKECSKCICTQVPYWAPLHTTSKDCQCILHGSPGLGAIYPKHWQQPQHCSESHKFTAFPTQYVPRNRLAVCLVPYFQWTSLAHSGRHKFLGEGLLSIWSRFAAKRAEIQHTPRSCVHDSWLVLPSAISGFCIFHFAIPHRRVASSHQPGEHSLQRLAQTLIWSQQLRQKSHAGLYPPHLPHMQLRRCQIGHGKGLDWAHAALQSPAWPPIGSSYQTRSMPSESNAQTRHTWVMSRSNLVDNVLCRTRQVMGA